MSWFIIIIIIIIIKKFNRYYSVTQLFFYDLVKL